ncbi:nucleotidyltransferase substrate binding protein [Bacillus shivajii]|uniref:nucleotidyltransferase substrate binding protein n=1 Tax=Bacillus shivajii TaxID=1983719 RepID=UPI001CFAA9F8|nr:nucleotidyltransferase substrate binding protein [Bacillus shivajii]UCZ52588.1 nucleotidyltransferase substrate binding protein [Bacillus shivajii]
MDSLREELLAAEKVLKTFQQLLKTGDHRNDLREATVQRFGFTFDVCWKIGQQYLLEKEGVQKDLPEDVFCAGLVNNLLNAEETDVALQMVSDRELAVHIYNEDLVHTIYDHLPSYEKLLSKWLRRIKHRI